MEVVFLFEIRFKVIVKPDQFYSFCGQLLAETVHPDIIRCLGQSEYVATLQAAPANTTSPQTPPLPPADEEERVARIRVANDAKRQRPQTPPLPPADGEERVAKRQRPQTPPLPPQ